MANDISLDEYKESFREIKTEEEKRDFFIHLTVYILVNALIIVVNFLYTPSIPWFLFPLIGWGIGIVSHYLESVRWIDEKLEVKEAQVEARARRKKKE